MKIVPSKKFSKDFKKLPDDIKPKLKKTLTLLKDDQNHPSLRTKKNHSWSAELKEKVYESSINMDYRVLWIYTKDDETEEDEITIIILLAVGKHKIVDV